MMDIIKGSMALPHAQALLRKLTYQLNRQQRGGDRLFWTQFLKGEMGGDTDKTYMTINRPPGWYPPHQIVRVWGQKGVWGGEIWADFAIPIYLTFTLHEYALAYRAYDYNGTWIGYVICDSNLSPVSFIDKYTPVIEADDTGLGAIGGAFTKEITYPGEGITRVNYALNTIDGEIFNYETDFTEGMGYTGSGIIHTWLSPSSDYGSYPWLYPPLYNWELSNGISVNDGSEYLLVYQKVNVSFNIEYHSVSPAYWCVHDNNATIGLYINVNGSETLIDSVVTSESGDYGYVDWPTNYDTYYYPALNASGNAYRLIHRGYWWAGAGRPLFTMGLRKAAYTKTRDAGSFYDPYPQNSSVPLPDSNYNYYISYLKYYNGVVVQRDFPCPADNSEICYLGDIDGISCYGAGYMILLRQ